MPANDRSTYLPYQPGQPPVLDSARELSRATWDELIRIAQSLIDLDRPASLSVAGSDSITATTSGQTYSRLFDASPSIVHEMPGGCFDPASGIYTVPQEGIYQIYARMNVPAFPSPQNKSYVGYLRYTISRVAGGTITGILESGGFDDTILTVQGMSLNPLYKGDQIWMDGAITRAAGGGTVVVTDTLQIHRISGIT